MKKGVFALFALILAAAPCRAGDLTLTIRDGLVSLDAQNVTVREILAEWARVGKTRIVNLERVTAGPVTLRLEGVREADALDIVLRAVPGYVAAPRPSAVADASIYDRILIMATTTVVAARPQAPVQPPAASPDVTQLRMAPPPMLPDALPEPLASDEPEPPLDPSEDPAIAAAAAAGLMPIQARPPIGTFVPGALTAPTRTPSPSDAQPENAAPSNPWNAPVGTAQPGLAPPTPPAAAPAPAPLARPAGAPRLPQAVR